MSQVANAWTFDRLTLGGNEGVGVEIKYLECAYSTRFYIIDQVNGHISAIHDDNIELTVFLGHFCPFKVEDLEMKVGNLADHNRAANEFTQGIVASQKTHQYQTKDSASNSKLHSLENLTDMGFHIPNYSPIPLFGNASSQQPGAAVLTLTPRPDRGAAFNTSDPTHSRGKVNIVNLFVNNWNQVQKQRKSSKGGKVKSSQTKSQPQPGTSTQVPSGNTDRPQVHCSTCGGLDHLRKDCSQDDFCT